MEKTKRQFRLRTMLLYTVGVAMAFAMSQTAGYFVGFLVAGLVGCIVWALCFAGDKSATLRLSVIAVSATAIWSFSIKLVYQDQICLRCRSEIKQVRVFLLGIEIWKDQSEVPSVFQSVLHDVEHGCIHSSKKIDYRSSEYSGLFVARFSRTMSGLERIAIEPYSPEMQRCVRLEYESNPSFSQELNDYLDQSDHAQFGKRLQQALKTHGSGN